MNLLINKQTTIQNIQAAFNSAYPFLKVVFYAQEPARNKPGHKKILDGNVAHLLAGDLEYHFIDVNKNRTVADVEHDFVSIGMQAQILRKSGTVWIETLLTRNWVLERQNGESEMLSLALMPAATNHIKDYKN